MPIVHFVWSYEHDEPISLCGSFYGWSFGTVLEKNIMQNIYETFIVLEPGTYQYKFKLQNKWCYDMNKPTITDEHGNINNIIVVK